LTGQSPTFDRSGLIFWRERREDVRLGPPECYASCEVNKCDFGFRDAWGLKIFSAGDSP
jgi:hypothetical protein